MNIETRDYAPHTVRTSFKDGYGTVAFVVSFGLHSIKGNQTPYFSVTGDGRYTDRRGGEFGGCCHDIVLQQFPDLADMVALHLSNIDGVPMHAEANGRYYLEADTFINGKKRDPIYRDGSKSDAQVVADHFRITLSDAEALRKQFTGTPDNLRNAFMKDLVDGMRPRWKQEAHAAIRKYKLGVYGAPPWQCTPAELLKAIEV